MRWATRIVRAFNLAGGSTLEVGSYNVNGSVRCLFHGPYVGVDMRDGPGVDKVAFAADLPFEDGEFDTIVSTEMLEHDLTFWLSIAEMARVLRPDGHLLVTCRGNGFPKHDYPTDFYRFSVEALTELFTMNGIKPVSVEEDERGSPGVLAVGRKQQ